jgi:Protein of unknown function (DUF1579)
VITQTVRVLLIVAMAISSWANAQETEAAKLFKRDVGTWEAEVKMYTEPNAAPQVSKGVETNFMLGDHWLIGSFKGSIMGMDFQGSSQNGYDMKKKKFVSTWVDSMSPAATHTEGTWDEKTQTLTATGSTTDPSGVEMKIKQVVVYGKDGSRHFTMYGNDAKMMEIKYTKVADKAATIEKK